MRKLVSLAGGRPRTPELLVLAVVFSLIAVACTSVTTMTHGGGRIRVLEAATAKCDRLGKVVKQNTNSWQEPAVAQEDARNKVLNEAASMGGTHIVSFGYVHHLPATCEDCVQLTADVYRCAGPVPDKSVAEVFTPPPPQQPTPPAQPTEWNHDGHDEVCAEMSGGKGHGDACQFDTECMICHDGSDCGVVVNRATFVSRGAACNEPDKAECEAAAPRCCGGVCVLAPR